MTEKIKVNVLPSRTWNRLGVNEAEIEWDSEAVSAKPAEELAAYGGASEQARVAAAGTDGYSEQSYILRAEENSALTVFMQLGGAGKLAVHTQLDIGKNARIRLVQFLNTKENALLYSTVSGAAAENGCAEIIQIILGGGDVYSDDKIDLNGAGSSLKADIGYLGRNEQKIDINLAVNHFGEKTSCAIKADGALKDSAQKIFRGTIDFKNGSSDSVGDELETVLMLGENAVNKTVPVILCAEENVQGNHGATIGELDEATLFYLESRGISRADAENMMARAAIERLVRLAGDEAFAEAVGSGLKEALGD